MRFSLPGFFFGTFVLFNTAVTQAAPVDQIIHAGQTWQKFPKSICENGSKAIKWKEVYWCPLTSYKYPQVDYKKPQVATPTSPKPVAPAPASTQQVHQIIHAGQTWQKFPRSICENGSKAISWKEVYWCPLTSYKTPQIDYKRPQVAAPTQPVTPTPTPTAPVHQIIHAGQTWQKFPTSICENGSKAIKWKEVYWCPLTSYKTAQVDYKKPQGGVVSPAPAPTPVPPPTPTPVPTPPPPATAEPTYSAQLSWAPPAMRENGNVLTLGEINRYEVYYVSDDGGDSGTMVVSGGAKNSCVVSGLASGVWHFSISAIDSQGVKSRLSSVLTGSVGS